MSSENKYKVITSNLKFEGRAFINGKYMQYEVIWITIFVMGMLGLLFDVTIRKIIDKTIPWRGKG